MTTIVYKTFVLTHLG